MRHLITTLALCCLLTPLSPAGKSKDDNNDATPRHIELGPDQGIYDALITDGDEHVAVTKISFAGDTVLDGVKKEHDNSANRISIADITSLRVLDAVHESIRYPQQEFARVLVTTTTGATEEMLFPRNLMVCGQAKESNIKKSWFIRSLNNINIKHGLHDPVQAVTAHQTAAAAPLNQIVDNILEQMEAGA